MPQTIADQFSEIVSWIIVTLLSFVTFLVGWIFRRELKTIDDRFLQMLQIFQERMSKQDADIKNINHSLSRLHDRVDLDFDDGCASSDTERIPPRRRRADRRIIESREDQERSSGEV